MLVQQVVMEQSCWEGNKSLAERTFSALPSSGLITSNGLRHSPSRLGASSSLSV
jgi:hypothetical protein